MLDAYKQEAFKKEKEAYTAIIKRLAQDNSILKKGVLIQNRRIQEAMQKAADYERLSEENRSLNQQMSSLKTMNSFMMSQLLPRDTHNRYTGFFGGDPMA